MLTQSSPFDVNDLTYRSDPRTGAAPSSGTVSSFDHLYDLVAGRLTLVSDRQPGAGSGTNALAVELRELRDRGLGRPAGLSDVAGEACRITRLGEPPVGPIALPDGSGHDDMCIDRNGIDVSDQWTYHGIVVERRTALEVRVGAADPSIHGSPDPSGAQRSIAPAILTVSPTASPTYLEEPPTPTGFTADQTVATIAYSPTDPTQVTDTSTIWSFSSGGAVLTVEAGQGRLPWGTGDTPTATIRLDGLGSAKSALRSDGPEIRVQLDQARWIRVRGTIPPGRLADYASELKRAAG